MSVYYSDDLVTLYHGDALDVLRTLPDASVDCCVTSPPYYGLRDYGVEPTEWPEVTYAPMPGFPQLTVPAMSCALGAEPDPIAFVAHLRVLFAEVRRVLADDGTLWLNLGDSYANDAKWGGSSGGKHVTALHGGTGVGRGKTSTGLPPKSLMGIPWRVAFALQDDGWILRSDIIWAKPSGMPESVTDRPTRSHEHVFLFAKSARYHYDAAAIAEDAVGGAKGSRFDTGKTAEHQQGRAQQGERAPRPQLARAIELAERHNLTDAHLDAIRAVGMSDAGKASVVQTGFGANAPEVKALAAEAKKVLGGYYREFLTAGTKNARDVWTIATQPFPGAHFAVMPPGLARRAVLAGCKPGGTVLDPFSGSGTTGLVAQQAGRKYVGIDLNADYLDLSLRTRLQQAALDLTEETA